MLQSLFLSRCNALFQFASVLAATWYSCCILPNAAKAQVVDYSSESFLNWKPVRHSVGSVPRSVAGVSLGHMLVDPDTPPELEEKILRLLDSYHATPWGDMTPEFIAAELSSLVPTYVDEMELDLLGLSPDEPLGSVDTGQLSSRLKTLLGPVELTCHIQMGALWITSHEAAEDNPTIRLYDVGPLLIPSRDPYTGSLVNDWTSLIHSIEQSIAPGSWLNAGGTSTALPLVVPGRNLLVVAAPTEVHRQLTAYLEGLMTTASPKVRDFYSAPPQPSYPMNPPCSYLGGSAQMQQAPGGVVFGTIATQNNLPRPHLKLRRASLN